VNNPGPMQSPEQSIVEQKVLRWFVRYGWIVLPGAALLVAYAIGLI
jgi:hypothetical protein